MTEGRRVIRSILVQICVQIHRKPADLSRRDFIVRCCQGASVAFVPARLRNLAFPGITLLDSATTLSSGGEFHLHPHYRAQRPLDALLLKTQAGTDDFLTEKYHDQIAAILAEWSSSLLRSPQEVRAFEKVLTPDFSGSSLAPVDSRLVRPGPAIEVHHNEFASQIESRTGCFSSGIAIGDECFFQLVTAEFQVTSIEAQSTVSSQLPERLQTRVRYELVGAGSGFLREQRVGYWDLEWILFAATSSSPGEFRFDTWQALDETRSRSASPVFVDITTPVLGGNVSYSAQMLRGVDYWRTVLDGACGIDIYGHNGVSVADIDNDGFDDLYVCQPAGLPNRLYRNRGDGTFEDITEASGLGILDNTACALFADFDNDGRQDVIVVRASGPAFVLEPGRRQVSIRSPTRFNSPTLRRELSPARPSPTMTATAGWIFIFVSTSITRVPINTNILFPITTPRMVLPTS